MNSLDILLYTILAAGTLYGFWIILHIVWFAVIEIYHKIDDEIRYYKGRRRIK